MTNAMILITALAATVSMVECFIDLHNALADDRFNGYTVTLSVGRSKKQVAALFSTTDDLTMTQCTNSRRDIPCSDRRCQSFSEKNCRVGSGSCFYDIQTGDGTISKGSVSTETLGLAGNSGSVMLGCVDANVAPVAGFGRGPLSILGQLNINSFAYCLSSGTTGKLGWGQEAGVPGGVVLPLVQDRTTPQFLFVGVASVGPQGSSVALPGRRMLISTATSLTKLPGKENSLLNRAVQDYIKAKNNKMRPFGYGTGLLDTCYNNMTTSFVVFSTCWLDPLVPGYFPDIELTSGAGKLVVPKERAFVAIDRKKTKICLAVSKATGEPILGSLWQTDFMVGISTTANTVTFKKTSPSCA
ncbi:Unknown protein [Striga hermonthica]|uniref:Peptidase A1 domain-containing protein n=1 Tax=Striga hermonthica TaxID=68872 RepID=A0A9N7R3G3_STRHE|nr:Unknown protein [Striga hermonthica]